MLIDTHTHLYWESFKDDIDQVIKRALKAGVTIIINVGVDSSLSLVALEQVENQLGKIGGLQAYSTIGIHPHEAIKYTQNTNDSIEKSIRKLESVHSKNPKKVIAVGECGLDFLFENNPDAFSTIISFDQIKTLQKQLFQSQIDLAKKLNLPLIVHCRDDRSKDKNNTEAWDQVLEMIGDFPAILHCYSGLAKTTNEIINNFPHVLVSFAAPITYPKNEYLKEAARLLPLEKICLETDSPFLPPQSIRGMRNEPSQVKEIGSYIAEIKQIPFDQLTQTTSGNVKKILFGSDY